MNWVIIGLDNGLVLVLRQTQIWTSPDILSISITPRRTYFNQISKHLIHENALENVHKMAAILSQPKYIKTKSIRPLAIKHLISCMNVYSIAKFIQIQFISPRLQVFIYRDGVQLEYIEAIKSQVWKS